MGAFQYIAVDEHGKSQKGIQEGDTARQVRQILRSRGLIPTSVEQIKEQGKTQSPGMLSFRRSISIADSATITRQLAILINSGYPVEEALNVTARQSNRNHVKTILHGVRSRVMEGFSFADALAAYPAAFSRLFCASIRAGESTGHLPEVLLRLADYIETRQEISQKISSALIYPVLLIIISIIIVGLLLGYVVPQVIQVFEGIGEQLPLMTRILLAISDFVKSYGVLLLLLFVVVSIGFKLGLKKPVFRNFVDRLLLRTPFVSKFIMTVNAARFSRTFSIMNASGVPILETFKLTSSVINNTVIQEAVNRAADRVREGESIHTSLDNTGYFPPLVTSLIASGESSGNLDEMLERAAMTQERELEMNITILLKIFEPMMIVIMALIVMFIVVSILSPIMEINQLIK